MVTPNIDDGSAFAQLLTLALGGSIADGANTAEDVYIDGVKIWPDPGGALNDFVGTPRAMTSTAGKRWSPRVLQDAILAYFRDYSPPVAIVVPRVDPSNNARTVLYLLGYLNQTSGVISAPTGARWLGSAGLVSTAANGINIRGPAGSAGAATTLIALTDTPTAFGAAGQMLVVNSSRDAMIWQNVPAPTVAGATTFLALTDTPAAYGTAGQMLVVNAARNGLAFQNVPTPGPGGGATTFLALTDTPAAFGTAGQVLAVNSQRSGLGFTDGTPGPAGPTGSPGFSPQIIVEPDGARRVLKLHKWLHPDSAPTDPTDNLVYLAGTGWVSTAGGATDVRGPQGAKGDPGAPGQGLAVARAASGSGIDVQYDTATRTLTVDSSGLNARLTDALNRIAALEAG